MSEVENKKKKARSTPYSFNDLERLVIIMSKVAEWNARETYYWISSFKHHRLSQTQRKQRFEKLLNSGADRESIMQGQKSTTDTLSAVVAKNEIFRLKEVRSAEFDEEQSGNYGVYIVATYLS